MNARRNLHKAASPMHFHKETRVMPPAACDLCGRELSRLERQYVAIIDIRPTVGIAAADEDPGDRDHLLELHELLEAAQDYTVEDDPQPLELLLCHDCCRRFREEPLPRESALQLDFSEN